MVDVMYNGLDVSASGKTARLVGHEAELAWVQVIWTIPNVN